ncbi:MAG: nucleotide disphospho-sugar-binding domain-containing protein [Actinocatenispora sp.]
MRVMFATVPAAGHIFPLVPLAWALRAEGHEVLVASWDGAEKVAESGLQWVNVAPGLRMYEEVFGQGGVSAAGTKLPDEFDRFRRSWGADREAFVALFSHVNDKVADSMVATARNWRPDLVVFEFMSHSGLVAAGALGVPAVQYGIGFQLTTATTVAALPHLAPTFARHGVDQPPTAVDVIHNVPDSMRIGEHGRWPVRPVANSGGCALPDWLARPADRPRVAVTLGTVSPSIGGLDRLRRTVSAAAQVDAEFVVAMGGFDIGQLGDLPANVRGADWLPWDALVDTCSAVVHHGGASVAMSGLSAGLPQLVLPDGADRDLNATVLRDRGVALSATPDDIDAALLRQVISDDKLRSAAADARAEVAAMDSPAVMARRLADLVDAAR